MERFALELRASISPTDKNKEQEKLEILTSNVCAGGAFFRTEQPLPVGTEVKIELVLHGDKFRKGKCEHALIKLSGSVIRTEREGMAIRFGNDYEILPLSERTYH
jgi:hypothetical protein